jgi:hypothetical protein
VKKLVHTMQILVDVGFVLCFLRFVCWRVLLDGEKEDTGEREERECKNMRERKRIRIKK